MREISVTKQLAGYVSEQELQKAIVAYAKLQRWLVYHTYDSRRSNPGFPDLVLVKNGRVIFAELKSQRGRLRAEQALWLAELRKTGLEAYVWFPLDWMEGTIEKILDEEK